MSIEWLLLSVAALAACIVVVLAKIYGSDWYIPK